MTIAVDFDGTCVSHEFPKVGKEIGAVPVLRELVHKGHKLILYTMRSDETRAYSLPNGNTWYGNTLQDAIDWFKKHGIPLYGINKNPTQETWTSSPKIYAHLYIDDAALGVPLIHPFNTNTGKYERPYVDWFTVQKRLGEYLDE